MADFPHGVFEALKRPIAFHPVFAKITGSINAALFLSQAFYWQKRAGEWWWKTTEEWTEETCLSRREQETARRKLRELGLIHEEFKGSPPKLFFSVDYASINSALANMAQTDEINLAESAKFNMAESAKMAENPSCTNPPSSYSETTDIKNKEGRFLSAKADDHKTMIRIWIEELPNLPKPRGCTDQRRRKLQQRLKDFCDGDLELWRQACQRIAAAPHLCGDNDRGWTANLDWVLEPRNLTKILEGNYDARQAVPRETEAKGVMADAKRILQRAAAARDRRDHPPMGGNGEEQRANGEPRGSAVAVLPDGREVPLHGSETDDRPVDCRESVVSVGDQGFRGRTQGGARPCDAADRKTQRSMEGNQEQFAPDVGSAIGHVVSARAWPSADETTAPARKPGDGHGPEGR